MINLMWILLFLSIFASLVIFSKAVLYTLNVISQKIINLM